MIVDWSSGYEELTDDPPKGDGQAQAAGSTIGEDAWPVMPPAAYRGLAGEFVSRVAPHTEADNVALHLTYLTSFGSAVGRQPYYQVGATQHFANLFVLATGRTSRARKGTAADQVLCVFRIADPDWAHDRIHSGMSTGEGMIMPIRDPVFGMRKGVEELIDPGVADKRLLLDEREFYQALSVMKREGNTLSRMVRDAWDCREVIGSLTKHSPTKATKPYVSIIGHITVAELRGYLDQTAMLNGFANRFLFACVRRSKLLPHGGALSDEVVAELGLKTLAAIEAARRIGRVTMTPKAAHFWEEIYAVLSKDEDGLMGAVTARAEAQTIRLALIYALLDQSTQIDRVHLDAALAVWSYCEASARYIFGDLLGDPVADTILRALRTAGSAGMSRSDFINLFGRNVSAWKIDAALKRLLIGSKVRCETQKPAIGRPREVWFAV
jgi:hypothetical protein